MVAAVEGLGGETVRMERKHQSLIGFLESKTQRPCLCSAESKAENQRQGKKARGQESKAEGLWKGNNYPVQQHQLEEQVLPNRQKPSQYILKCIFKHLDSYCSSVRLKITILVMGFFFLFKSMVYPLLIIPFFELFLLRFAETL